VGDLAELVCLVTVNGHSERESCLRTPRRTMHITRIGLSELGVEIAGLRIGRVGRKTVGHRAQPRSLRSAGVESQPVMISQL
jgi:hypothetical protein